MTVVVETDLALPDGRGLHVYDTGALDADDQLAVFWHHGTPGIGAPPAPLFAAATERRVRWVSYDRPGYGGSTARPNRDIASAAADVASIADALHIERFAVMGHSGGGPHALACGALLPGVVAVASMAGLAPRSAEGLDWFAGMAESSEASLRAAAEGRASKARYEASTAFDPAVFTAADHATLAGTWSWLLGVVAPALEAGGGGLIDDDLAYVAPWGFDPARITAPVLLLHGALDRMVPASHSEWLARHCPSAELRICPDDGHISLLNSAAGALEWLCERADHR